MHKPPKQYQRELVRLYKTKLREASSLLVEAVHTSRLDSVQADPIKQSIANEIVRKQRRLTEFYLTKYEDAIGVLPPAPIEDRQDDCGCNDDQSVDPIDILNQLVDDEGDNDGGGEVDITIIPTNTQSYADALDPDIDDDEFFM